MADHSTFPFLRFLLCYYFPLICASFCDSLIAKEAELDKSPSDTVQLYNNNCVIIRYNENQLPKSRLLNLSSDTKNLPYNVLSSLKQKCQNELWKLLSNHILQESTVACTCEFIKGFTIVTNSTLCRDVGNLWKYFSGHIYRNFPCFTVGDLWNRVCLALETPEYRAIYLTKVFAKEKKQEKRLY